MTSRVEGGPAPPSLRERFAADPGLRESLRQRARLLAAVRSFFEQRGFLEVSTPCLVPAPDPAPHLESFQACLHLPGRAARALYLLTSPEHALKRLLAAGLERIFQIGPFFRDGELGPLHNPEFTGLEWYQVGASVEDTLALTEALVRDATRAVTGGTSLPARAGLRVEVGRPFERLSLLRALRELAGVEAPEDWNEPELRRALAAAGIQPSMDDAFDDLVNRALVARVEPALVGRGPVFLTDYPAPMAALARLRPDRPVEAERFELFIGGLELSNGYGELTDPREQRARFEAQRAERARLGRVVPPLDEAFLRALEQGMPPAGGNALGLDRLLMLLLGRERIEDVLPFPMVLEL
jgi:lysyl-tRNA synthetase class 2